METKQALKGIDEILEALTLQTRHGSCKNCQFRAPDECELFETSHFCAIQSNLNSIRFTEKSLDSAPYPARCDEGEWVNSDNEPVYGCLAFLPATEPVVYTVASQLAATRHRDFLNAMKRAADLHFAVKNGELDHLIGVINFDYGDNLPESVK